MKRIFVIIFIFFSFISFSDSITSNGLEGFKQYTIRELQENVDKLQPYDIIVLGRNNTIMSVFGHVMVVNKDKKIVEIKGFDEVFADSPIYYFLPLKDRKLTVLRYKNMTPELMEEIDKQVEKHYNKKYSVFVSENPENLWSYCSKFICNIYHDGGKELGQDINLLEKDAWPLYPFSFLERTDIFENVVF